MRKSSIVILGMIVLISMSFTIFKDEPRYKNLKVLPKNISEEKMDSVMKSFTVALGVKCNFCHIRQNDEWNFAADDNKHKGIAREMMKMTTRINKKYFNVDTRKGLDADLEVTCFTCHSGKAHPPKFPDPAPKK